MLLQAGRGTQPAVRITSMPRNCIAAVLKSCYLLLAPEQNAADATNHSLITFWLRPRRRSIAGQMHLLQRLRCDAT